MYVDDFKMSGTPGNLAKGWDKIRDENIGNIKLEDPKQSNLYMGCAHEHSQVTFADGTKAQAVTYNMESSLASTIATYETMSTKLMGRPMVLKDVGTPFVTEDQKNSPQGKPYQSGPYVT